MKTLTVGVIGHVDHGKTALVRALTGTDTDRLAEERRRGISIVLGFAYLEVPGRGVLDLVDVPGHERFVRAMVAGATGIGAVLLVVAANEGARPQTLEHLAIARLLGVRRGVIAVTKADLVSREEAEAAATAAGRLAAEVGGLSGARVVLTSAVTGRGVGELRAALADLLASTPEPEDQGFFHLPVDRAFAVAGFGAVVTGTLRRGTIAAGDEVELLPSGLRARVRGLQVHGLPVERAGPGRRVAVNLRGLKAANLSPGWSLATPGMVAGARWLDVELRLLPHARPLASGDQVRLLLGTTEAVARLRLLDRAALAPGEAAVGQLRCAEDVAAPAGEPFVLHAGSPAVTVGGGLVLDPASGRRRRDPEAARHLAALARATPPQALDLHLREAGHRGRRLEELCRLVARPPARVRGWAKEAGARVFGDGTVLHAEVAHALEGRALALLDTLHRERPAERGLTREALRSALPADLPAGIATGLLAGLVDRGELVAEEGLLRRKGFRPPPRPAAGRAAVAREVEGAFRLGALTPPDAHEVVAGRPERERALRELARAGVLVRALDKVQKREVVFHKDAVEQARRTLAAAFPDGAAFLVGDAGRALGTSRKYAVPLLEHLDAAGFTRREGDRRVVTGRAGDGRQAAVTSKASAC